MIPADKLAALPASNGERRRVYVYASDRAGCGMFRLGWPARELQRLGHDVVIEYPDERFGIGAKLDKSSNVVGTFQPADAAVIVLQRTTHRHLMQCIPFWRAEGISVVVDVDDDLTAIHPSNPAWPGLRPGNGSWHDWNNLTRACATADVVTCSTPELARRYPGNTVVLPNYLPDEYYGLPRADSAEIMWPATIGSHPDDASVLSGVLGRLHGEGHAVAAIGVEVAGEKYRREFSMSAAPRMQLAVPLAEWPALLSGIGIGVAPLADTRFNASKSWLKPLELMGCGVPWVASPTPEYRKLHEATGVGFLAHRPRDWYRHLKRLATDAGLRAEQSAKGAQAAEQYRLSLHAALWEQTWLG